jgi:hypothetical protein
MANPLLAELEAVVSQLIQRRWVARAALVSDAGDVLAMYSSRAAIPSDHDADADVGEGGRGAAPSIDMANGVARLVVERLDDQSWIYVDLGVMRLVARLIRTTFAGSATTWLARELGRIGFTVERETLAQD